MRRPPIPHDSASGMVLDSTETALVGRPSRPGHEHHLEGRTFPGREAHGLDLYSWEVLRQLGEDLIDECELDAFPIHDEKGQDPTGVWLALIGKVRGQLPDRRVHANKLERSQFFVGKPHRRPLSQPDEWNTFLEESQIIRL